MARLPDDLKPTLEALRGRPVRLSLRGGTDVSGLLGTVSPSTCELQVVSAGPTVVRLAAIDVVEPVADVARDEDERGPLPKFRAGLIVRHE